MRLFERRRRLFWLVLGELGDRPDVPEELSARIARHTLGAFQPSSRAVRRVVERLVRVRVAEYVGATGFVRLSESGRILVATRSIALRGGA